MYCSEPISSHHFRKYVSEVTMVNELSLLTTNLSKMKIDPRNALAKRKCGTRDFGEWFIRLIHEIRRKQLLDSL